MGSLFSRIAHERRLQIILAAVLVGAICAGAFVVYLVPKSPASKAARLGDDATNTGTAADGSVIPGSAGSAGSNSAGSSNAFGKPGSAGRAGSAGSKGQGGKARSGPGSGSGRTGPGGVPLDGADQGAGAPDNVASDTGITTTSIQLGFLRPVPTGTPISDSDLFARPEHAYARDINNHGGIHGRNIQILDEPFDPLLPSEVARACADLQSNHVFAVLNEAYVDGSCLTSNHIFFSHGGPAPAANYGSGLEFSVSASSQKVLANWVAALEGKGIHGKSLGTVEEGDASSLQVISQGFMQTLQSYGDNATETRPSCLESTSIQLAVTQMKSAGVTGVFLMTDPCVGPAFVNEANTQQFFPQYYTSDFLSTAQDFWAGNVTRRQGLNGAIGLTSWRSGGVLVGQGERSLETACRQRYQQQTGIALSADDTPTPQGDRQYEFAQEICGLMNDLQAGLNLNGPNPTRDRLSQAYRSLGTHQFPNNADITYGPGKFDGGTSQRAVKWDEGCDSNNGCYKPSDPPYGFTPYQR